MSAVGRAADFRLEALAGLQARRIDVSAAVVDLSSGDVLGALDADRRLLPASLTKLYTAAAALRQWGAAHTFTTRLLADKTPQGDALAGDLIFAGSGDPTLEHDDLLRLARQLRARGLRRVRGGLVVDVSALGRVACATKDRCEAERGSVHSFDAPLSAAGVDYSNVGLTVLPALRSGHSAVVTLQPFALPMFSLEAQVHTTAADSDPRLWLTRVSRAGLDRLALSGSVPTGAAPLQLYRSVSDPERFSGEMLRAALHSEDIALDGGIAVRTEPGTAMAVLAAVEGQPLGEQLRRMLVFSNNYIADLLALDLLRAQAPQVEPTLHNAGKQLAAFAATLNHSSRFGDAADGTGPLLYSGSGLTVENRVSARDLVALLDQVYLDTADFPAFVGALTVPEQTPVTTLQKGDQAWLTRIAAKTGTLSEPLSVFALAGYFRFQDGHWGAFAMLANGQVGGGSVRVAALDAMRADLERLLASR